MREYELALVIDASLDEEAVAALVAQMTELITKHHGTVAAPKVWGKKPLAYPVDEKTEGSYVFIPFSSEPPALTEIYRVLRYNQQVLRHLVVHAVPESPEMAPRVVTRRVETFVPPGKLRPNAEQAVAVATAERPDIEVKTAKELADAASSEQAVPTASADSSEAVAEAEQPTAAPVVKAKESAKPKAETKAKPAAKGKASPKPKAEAKEKSVAKPKATAATKAKADAKPLAKAKSKVETEAKPVARAKRKDAEPSAKAAKK